MNTEWYRGDPSKGVLGVGALPHRKRPMLYATIGPRLVTLATFRDEDAAEEFKSQMQRLIWQGTVTDDKEKGQGG